MSYDAVKGASYSKFSENVGACCALVAAHDNAPNQNTFTGEAEWAKLRGACQSTSLRLYQDTSPDRLTTYRQQTELAQMKAMDKATSAAQQVQAGAQAARGGEL